MNGSLNRDRVDVTIAVPATGGEKRIVNIPQPAHDRLMCDVEPRRVDHTLAWIAEQGGVPTIVFMLKLTDEAIDGLCTTQEHDARSAIIYNSARHRLADLATIVADIDRQLGLVHWSGFVELPYMHAAVVTRPKQALYSLIDYLVRLQIISGLIPNYALREPLSTVDEPTKKQIEERRREVEWILSAFSDDDRNGYINSLGGVFFGEDEEWWLRDDDSSDAILRACILDSGVDESHVSLQGRILAHDLFDFLGQEKEARYSFDRSCHGTMVGGMICARSLSGPELGLDRPTHAFRISAGPSQARLSVVNITAGMQNKEATTLAALLGGLNWAVQNRDHPAWGGYGVVNMSISLVQEQFYSEVSELMDDALNVLISHRLVPIIASGDKKQRPLGTVGVYVGAMGRDGQPMKSNENHVDLFAPGDRVLAIQPAIPPFGCDLISCCSGSSLAAAYVTGVILHLQGTTGRPAHECVTALLQTADNLNRVRPREAFRCF